jgi:hypothetical protein
MRDTIEGSVVPDEIEAPASLGLEETLEAIHQVDQGNGYESEVKEEGINWDHWLAYEMEHAAQDLSLGNSTDGEESISDHEAIDGGEWFPFKSKLVSLILNPYFNLAICMYHF